MGSSKYFSQDGAPVVYYSHVLSYTDATAYFLFDLHEQYENSFSYASGIVLRRMLSTLSHPQTTPWREKSQ